MTTASSNDCPYCGMGHTGTCPRVKAIEYDSDGAVRRVEFHEPDLRYEPTLRPAVAVGHTWEGPIWCTP